MNLPSEVAILEDDLSVAMVIQMAVYKAGCRGVIVRDRAELMSAIAGDCVAAVVLDLGLPDDDGISILRDLRRISSIPVLIVSARSEVGDRVHGLMTGADDYLVKPFSIDELSARLSAIFRRVSVRTVPPYQSTKLRIDELTLDLQSNQLAGSQATVVLTDIETRIIEYLCKNDSYATRQMLYPAVFGRPWVIRDRSLDVHMHNLREKFKAVGLKKNVIQAKRNLGYRLLVSSAWIE